jgi:hypothetical protein
MSDAIGMKRMTEASVTLTNGRLEKPLPIGHLKNAGRAM